MAIPARLAPLLAQFDFALDRLLTRMEGLSDAEYHWELVPDGWTVCPREQARTTQVSGRGSWVMELARPAPDPAPVPTMAWRICHLATGLLLRADYTTGTSSLSENDLELPGTALGGIEILVASSAAWRGVLASVSDADLDQVGRSQFPWGLDPELPLLDIVWWVNQEVLHHGAEMALLRDLYRAQVQGTSSIVSVKTRLLTETLAARGELDAALAALAGGWDVPVGDGWRVRDLLAHLALWERVAVWKLTGAAVPDADDLMQQNPWDLDTFNTTMRARWHDRPIDAVLWESHAAHAALLATIVGATEGACVPGGAVRTTVDEDGAGHYRVHLPALVAAHTADGMG